MFHFNLLELESELIAKEDAARGVPEMSGECIFLIQSTEAEVGARLGDKAPPHWRGWLTFKRTPDSLVICRGHSFSGGMFGQWRAGLDVPDGANTLADYERGFAVTLPNDLDHLLINFGSGEKTRVFLWYGEGIAPHKLIFEGSVDDDPQPQLQAAVIEACAWILHRPKHLTLLEFLKQQEKS